ncbi:glycosyltransferase [Oceanihabitans sediminis]|uniref:Glycosyltransferase n=1 Tax=Oceanihabitans sediminis TaxID=1812012 RepID=A0A368P878_9FLAO|nr:glycosyltransferase [Oceanihabitans sediminis]MDX1277191.1 glycosyltransferase [Oceanihabitans sediminis]MDX1773609.1 glycosyltransferase [Oceanihabitans sediminis]RBP33053.1 N-acetylgalactosamine-N,N'-diacetylbacillosaminyl-diphospho-undecaprenol 4-alpha-N-acetylgalactosaminyltransferase [Oceanihabitans sediminis]RCU57431.1 glycosyltransferase [Oceanihabitans sediminis]
MKNKKNIALFAAFISYSGTERVVCRLANELVKYYNVTLVLMFNTVDLAIHKDVQIIPISKMKHHYNHAASTKLKTFLYSAIIYSKILKENNIDISISFLVKQNIINSITKMRNPKLKTIISERCFPSKTYDSTGKKLVKYFYNKNDALFSNSIHINKDLSENFDLNIPSYVLYNPIYTLEQQPDFVKNPKEKNPFKIIAVGRLNPVKNYKSLIETIPLLEEKVELNIYGAGILEEDLKNLTNSLKLNELIIFKGNSNSIDQEIQKHHCLVLTSLSEGFPNVILEAMSLGVPVIATNCMSGPLELLNDNEEVEIEIGNFYKAKYGLLVNVDDKQGLAKAISYYKNQEDVRKNYSNLSFQKAKQYDISEIGKQTKNLIDKYLCVE